MENQIPCTIFRTVKCHLLKLTKNKYQLEKDSHCEHVNMSMTRKSLRKNNKNCYKADRFSDSSKTLLRRRLNHFKKKSWSCMVNMFVFVQFSHFSDLFIFINSSKSLKTSSTEKSWKEIEKEREKKSIHGIYIYSKEESISRKFLSNFIVLFTGV